MPKIIRAILGLVAGYAIGAVLGVLIVNMLSSNTHDKSLEVVMTAAFVVGPIGAVLGLIAGLLGTKRILDTAQRS